MAQPQRRPRVAVYTRISDDSRDGTERGLGVQRQREDCMARVEREGWEVVETFSENDVGASSKSRKTRPLYKRLIALAEAGEIDIILSYSASRLTRRPLELEALISLHERKGVLLRTIVSGDTDLATADGRAVARTIAAWDAAEAERISERVARAAKQRKERGEWHGGFPPYGYQRLGDGRLGIDPDRAAVVNEVALRVLSGETLNGVRLSLNRRGITTGRSPRSPQGGGWQQRTIKRVLTTPATIGCAQTDDGVLHQVAEPVLDRATWDRLREILFDPSRFTESQKPDWSNRRKYPLSGLLFCALCGHTLSGSSRVVGKKTDGQNRPTLKTFACIPGSGGCGRIRIDYRKVEAWVLNDVFHRISVPGVQTSLASRDESADDAELRQQIADDERRLERLDDDYSDGTLDRARYRRQVARLTERVDTLRSRLAVTLRSTFVVDTQGRSLRAVWDEHADDVSWQRTLLEHVLDRVVIHPHPAGVTSTVNRKRSESAEQLENRRKEHSELILRQRVEIKWLT
jgi:site-specific DNA recombinase